MRRLRLWLALAGTAALAAGGAAGAGKLALVLGAPGLAAKLISDPATRGAALYQAGDYAAADRAFAEAGRSSTYNRGLSLAATGRYALSVAYFDAVLFANPVDAQARDNRAVVSRHAPVVVGESDGKGRIAVKVAQPSGPPVESFSHLRKPLDEGGRVADDAWLDGLADDPGEFLRLRLADENQRRISLGFVPHEGGDPW
ncbi:hypothetical protein [Neomegalonema sp.]|uniref:hypothetical protein n=1 Tax=Neomegalonema sp. TaxID=2039713 RepID=UPI002609A061|nr:hypothetical protein [Neomegalonema sp.]MDD2867309.1 hypothetical protein [Neomegalonema sp.]